MLTESEIVDKKYRSLFDYKTIKNGTIMNPIKAKKLKNQNLIILKQENIYTGTQEITIKKRVLVEALKMFVKTNKKSTQTHRKIK